MYANRTGSGRPLLLVLQPRFVAVAKHIGVQRGRRQVRRISIERKKIVFRNRPPPVRKRQSQSATTRFLCRSRKPEFRPSFVSRIVGSAPRADPWLGFKSASDVVDEATSDTSARIAFGNT